MYGYTLSTCLAVVRKKYSLFYAHKRTIFYYIYSNRYCPLNSLTLHSFTVKRLSHSAKRQTTRCESHRMSN